MGFEESKYRNQLQSTLNWEKSEQVRKEWNRMPKFPTLGAVVVGQREKE